MDLRLAEDMMGFRGDRVREHTDAEINRQVDREMQERVQYFAKHHPGGIDARMEDLNREWDMERTLETNASILALAGVTLAVFRDRRWLLLPAVVLSFLLQHAIQGWCPPVPLFRRFGVRTQREIEAERYALKSLQKEREAEMRDA